MTRRQIAYECMFCHNAYPEIPATAHRDLSANPVYNGPLPEGIDCQRCHGPGAAHVKTAQSPGVSAPQIRALILNPARLNNEHKIVNAPYRLRQSQCYLKSEGALTCETCHNPHDLHKGPESASYYASICMKCHAATLPAQIALNKHPASNDCVSCHMPKRLTEDVVHAIMPDHLIQRHPPSPKELLGERLEVPETAANAYRGEVRRYLLDHENHGPVDDLYDGLAQVIDSSNLEAGIPHLEEAIRTDHPDQPNLFIELGDAMRHSGNLSGAIKAYRQALVFDPLSSCGQRRLGATLGSAGQEDEALTILKKALEHEPNNALLWYEQALIESREGKREEAIEHLRKALQIKADFADAQNNLGANLAQVGDQQSAEIAFRAALTTNPYDGETRANLGRLLAANGDWKQAAFHLRKAVHRTPLTLMLTWLIRCCFCICIAGPKQKQRPMPPSRTIQNLHRHRIYWNRFAHRKIPYRVRIIVELFRVDWSSCLCRG